MHQGARRFQVVATPTIGDLVKAHCQEGDARKQRSRQGEMVTTAVIVRSRSVRDAS